MRLSLFTLMLSASGIFFAQDGREVSTTKEYPNTFSSRSKNIYKFDNKAKRFDDWAVSVGGGGAFMHRADLTSFYDGKIKTGWNAYISLDKQITHAFGLSLNFQTGKTNQSGKVLDYVPGYVYANLYDYLGAVEPNLRGIAQAYTKYNQLSILGDLNFSNLFRRVDNRSPYRWALHGYAGIGLMNYSVYREDEHPNPRRIPIFSMEQKLDQASFFFQGGIGLKYKLSDMIDLETRAMYIISGDDEFDAGGEDSNSMYNMINSNYSDNMFTVNLGVSFKLGKHKNHLAWHDPLREINHRMLSLKKKEPLICKDGDQDNDGVCDDWDRQLNTPAGARVDGAGVALDIDLDGVIDLDDKCVTVPGTIENSGCPTGTEIKDTKDTKLIANPHAITNINKLFEGIEFTGFNSNIIRPKSLEKLDQAAEIIKTLNPKEQYYVVSATEAAGSEDVNEITTQKKAEAVVKYLVEKGVPANMLIADGRGKKDLKYPECDPASKCPEWKNAANRRVFFEKK